MKSYIRFTCILLAASIFFFQCTPDHKALDNTREIITDGSWKVELFYQGQDQTALYRDFSFKFHANGSLEVTGTTDTCTGSWNILNDIDHSEVVQIRLPSTHQNLLPLNSGWSVTGKEIQRIAMKNRNDHTADLRIRKQ